MIRLARVLYGKWVLRRKNVSLAGGEKLDSLNGGFLLLSNHVNTLDPIFISSILPFHVRWVAGAYLFKFKGLGYILRYLATAIPKQQGLHDYSVLRSMQKALADNDVVGIFPEGTRTWDGETLPINGMALAKMAKFFKAPVCVISIEGGYAQKPRWTDRERRCPVCIRIRDVLMPDEIKAMGVDALSARLVGLMSFSNDDWQLESGVRVQSESMAECIERVLYLCPGCHAVGSIVSEGSRFHCAACGKSASLDGRFQIEGDFGFKDIRSWRRWEAEALGGLPGLDPEKGVQFRMMKNERMRTISKDITVSTDGDCLRVVDNTGGQCHEFRWADISSFVINARQTMEIMVGHDVYRIRLAGRSSSLKYQDFYEMAKQRCNQYPAASDSNG